MEFSAPDAVIAQNGAVELIDLFAARLLVESVDILGHHRGKPPLFLPSCQHLVGNVGHKAQGQHLLPVEPEEILRSLLIKAVGDNGFRRIFKFLIVQPVHTSEIGDSGFRGVLFVRPPIFAVQAIRAAEIFDTAFGAHARSSKGNNSVAFFYPSFQNFSFLHRITSFPLWYIKTAIQSTSKILGICRLLFDHSSWYPRYIQGEKRGYVHAATYRKH